MIKNTNQEKCMLNGFLLLMVFTCCLFFMSFFFPKYHFIKGGFARCNKITGSVDYWIREEHKWIRR